jgi:hypothetical protein
MGVYLMLAVDSKVVRMVNGHQKTFTWMPMEADRLKCSKRYRVYKSTGRLLNGIRT